MKILDFLDGIFKNKKSPKNSRFSNFFQIANNLLDFNKKKYSKVNLNVILNLIKRLIFFLFLLEILVW